MTNATQAVTAPLPFPSSEPELHASVLSESERLGALSQSGLMDSLPEAVFDRASRLATRLLGVPVSLLSLVDAERQFFKASTGLEDITETPLSHSFCQYVVSADRPLAVDDAREHPMLRGNGAVGDLNVVAYLGVPIHAPDGAVLGSFCAIDNRPHQWTPEQLDDLRDLALIIETEISLRRVVDERQLLINELNHRVKNLFAVVSGIVRMSQSAGETTVELTGRLHALSQAHGLIAPAIHANRPAETGTSLRALVETLLAPHMTATRKVRIEGDDIALGPKAATPLALALYELVTNAVKYGGLSGGEAALAIEWSVEQDVLHMRWLETGLSQAPRSQSQGKGFGSKLIALTLEGQLGGKVETERDEECIRRAITLPCEALAH